MIEKDAAAKAANEVKLFIPVAMTSSWTLVIDKCNYYKIRVVRGRHALSLRLLPDPLRRASGQSSSFTRFLASVAVYT